MRIPMPAAGPAATSTLITAGGLLEGVPSRATHQAAMAVVQQAYPDLSFVSSDSLGPGLDSVHFTGAQLVTLGQRHAAAVLPAILAAAGTGPLVILGMGQSNLVATPGATSGDHTIAPDIYVWNGSPNDGRGTAWIPAQFGVAPFARGVSPYANNLLVHMANDIRAAIGTGRDIYLLVQGKQDRNAESFLASAVAAASGWTQDLDLTAHIYPDVADALAAIPGRPLAPADCLVWQHGEANPDDDAATLAAKVTRVLDELAVRGLISGGDWLIDSGQNANGRYTRWADGTLICRHVLDLGSITALGSGIPETPYRTAAGKWTFPFPYAEPPAVSAFGTVFVANVQARPNSVNCGLITTTAANSIIMYRATSWSDAASGVVNLMAIGRWF